jgi:prepilin-type N-terminal cleavage/methylation domain-containing protein
MRNEPGCPERGVTLLEVMIAMTVLAIGLLAMWQLHVVGLTSNAAARRNTSAVAIAEELVSGLERLAYSDPLLSDGATPSTSPPSDFGPLVQGDGSILSSARVHTWDDSAPVPGVRLNSAIRERLDPNTNLERRWSIWTVQTASAASGAILYPTKMIAVSVTWNDPPFNRPREVLLYTQVSNASVVRSSVASSDQNAWDRAAP